MGGELMRWLFLACALLCGSAHAQMLQANTNAVTHSGGTPLTISCPSTGTVSFSITCTGTYTGTAPATTGWTYAWNTTCTGSGSVTSVASVSLGSITGIVVPTPSGVCAGTVTLTTNIPTSNGSGVVTISGATAWTFINVATCAGANGCTTSAVNMTGANLFIAVETAFIGSCANTISPSDSSGNTWPLPQSVSESNTAGGNLSHAFWIINPTVSASQTFTFAGGAGGLGCFAPLIVIGFNDSSGTPVIDGAGSGNQTSGTSTIQPGAITPSASDELVVTTNSSGNVGQTFSVSSPYSPPDAQVTGVSGVNYGEAIAHAIIPTPSAQNPTWTDSASGNQTAIILQFKH